MKPKIDTLPFLVLSVLLFTLIPQIMADTTALQVLPHEEKAIAFTLSAGDSASVTLVMNSAATVDFWITDPQSRNVTAYSHTGNAEFSFDAQTSGTFLFHVYNRNLETALGTLNYTLVHRILGVPQEIFLLLVIVVIVFIMLFVWAASSKS